MNEQPQAQNEVKSNPSNNFSLPAFLLGFLGIIITTCIGVFLFGGFKIPFLVLMTGPLAIAFFFVDLICCGLGVYFGVQALQENGRSKTVAYLAIALNAFVLLAASCSCLLSVAVLNGN